MDALNVEMNITYSKVARTVGKASKRRRKKAPQHNKTLGSIGSSIKAAKFILLPPGARENMFFSNKLSSRLIPAAIRATKIESPTDRFSWADRWRGEEALSLE